MKEMTNAAQARSLDSLLAGIKEMEAQIDCDNFEEVQEKCLFQIEKEDWGISAVEPLLLFMERHPLSDFGMPGAIVHYVEQFYKKGYEDLLIASAKEFLSK